MPGDWNRILQRLSRDDLQKLLDAKAEIEELEGRREVLRKELASVEKDLARLAGGRSASLPGRRRAVAKTTRKNAAAKKAAAKKAPGKKAAGKKTAGRKATPRKAAPKKAAPRGTRAKAVPGKAAGRPKLEDVVVAILKENGEPMPFKALMAAIVEGKRFESRSRNFDNVLRRTLSTSERIKRRARGIYGL